MNTSLTDLDDKLRLGGYKMTTQRQAIYTAIQNTKERHLCVEELFAEVKKSYPSIGLATVYRTLKLFEKLGIVHHIALDDGRNRFQIIDSDEEQRHSHLICEKCGEVIDVDENALKALDEKLLTDQGFVVKNLRTQIVGICRKCNENTNESQEE